MEIKPTVKQKYDMQQYVTALKQRVQERAHQLEQNCADKQKCELAKLQDEVTALAEIYRHYYYDVFTTANNSVLAQIDNVEQIEQILTTSKQQMIEGQIDKTSLIEVFKMAKQNLLKICEIGKISQYADMFLEEKEHEESNAPEERE
ncbi:MAG: hypothetical protein IJ777_02600 [Clostridia bacterium]|nr:hypothetical protein [Clostridia bacterium]